MKGMSWGVIGVLLVAGWLLQTIGETGFTVVFWIVVGLIVLAQVLKLLAQMGVLRSPEASASGRVNQAHEAKWHQSQQRRLRKVGELLFALERRNSVEVERLVLTDNVSPYESGSFHGKVGITGYNYAKEIGFDAAVAFFEAWTREGASARIQR
ncbi:hypothetical protein [Marilutibacter chinensis]|uniref:Uncharacterized protein n=1 Tax=Marilutibacter chinensis TaxID=2912247 RepID=A0ABS9HRU7_9GAMM|nr:hypothetical protein [Lysobacter chinensis]MCF7221013.1 hypothetical protein [Lysobacter chinensis]